MRLFVIIVSTFLCVTSNAQIISENLFQAEFDAAYDTYPIIPRGILEGVAYAQTRITHLQGNNEGCSGIPQVSGVMGLTEDGQGYFNNNLLFVSNISGIEVSEIKSSAASNIMAYASAYNYIAVRSLDDLDSFQTHDQILKTLSEIPWGKNAGADFALSCYTYEVFQFLNDPSFQEQFDFPAYDIDYNLIYGTENYQVLSSTRVLLGENKAYTEDAEFRLLDKSVEYGPAIWNAAPSCNYSSRSGTSISAVTVHTIQGSYAGAIAWAKNCASNVSYHYVVRSSDGQVTQMVLEEDKAWHVGSENPYTIGIEHEGYVDNPIWYTEAMYVESASLVKDITDSGYEINPLRTYQGVATTGTLTLGACTKIKGHQHFPGAAHTDPGINWDWEHYYRLINDAPEIVLNTSETGVSFDSGGEAENYENDERELFLIQPPGAISITLNVLDFDIEEGWDFLYVYDGESLEAPLIGVYTGTEIPEIITSSGGSLLIEFRSDCGLTHMGWEFNWVSTVGVGVGDEIPPITDVSIESDWQTDDFPVFFEDSDEGTGVRFQLMQVIDYNGLEWRGNGEYGFLSDNFDTDIHPEWSVVNGDWVIEEEVLLQTNEEIDNSNIYASLNQEDFDTYFYHWSGRISGDMPDKRMGLHFMCDNPTLTNRGNSYFVWFREDGNQVQIYKVVDDVFILMYGEAKIIDEGVWYDFKTLYDKTSGEIHVWMNNELVASWTDEEPIVVGNSVSFRTGNAIGAVNNFKVYHNRVLEEEVTIGPLDQARFQNTDPYTPAAKVKSIVIDSALNLSNIKQQLVDIDWTPPVSPTFVNDGLEADISTMTSNTEITANWGTTADENSEIARYWYAIGTFPGGVDIVDWTDNWYADSIVHTGLSLIIGTTYYVSVFAENGAGLPSEIITSDGQLLVVPTEPPHADFTTSHTNLCLPDSLTFENGSADAVSYLWQMPGGSPSISTTVNPTVFYASSGDFVVTLIASGPGGDNDTLTEVISITVNDLPHAGFEPSSVEVDIDDSSVLFNNLSTNSDSYYWSFGDGVNSSEEEPYHAYETIGEYVVSLIAFNGGCPNDISYKTIIVDDFNGIDDNQIKSCQLYPNPASSFIILTFQSNVKGDISYQITDATGRIIIFSEDRIENGELRIDLSKYEKGTYFFNLLHENEIVVSPFVIE